MKWSLSDGTEVWLSGRVRGTTSLAEALRYDALATKQGSRAPVQVEVHPNPSRRLDFDDPQLVDVWIRNWAARYDVTILEAPELKPIERFDSPTDPDAPPDRIY